LFDSLCSSQGVEDLLHAYLRHVGVNIEGIEGHTAFYYEKGRTLTELYVDPRNEIICEVGYNAGHSSLNALLAKTNSRVVSFDLGMHRERYGQHSFDVLSHFFPERLEVRQSEERIDNTKSSIQRTLFKVPTSLAPFFSSPSHIPPIYMSNTRSARRYANRSSCSEIAP